MVQNRGADHDVEGFRSEEMAVQVKAEGLNAPAQFVAGLDERGEHTEELRRDFSAR